MLSNFVKTTLGELAEITSSKRIFANEYVETGIPFYRGKEITEKSNGNIAITTELFIDEDRYTEIQQKYGTPTVGDILLTSVGTLGNTYQVQTDDKFYFKDGNITWFRGFSRNVDSSFLLYWLRSPAGQYALEASAIGTTQKALTISNLKKISINLPTLKNQKAISKFCKSIDSRIFLLQETNQTLEAIAQAIFKSWFVDFDPVRAKSEGREPEGISKEMADLFPSEFESSDLGDIPKGWVVESLGTYLTVIETGRRPKGGVSSFTEGVPSIGAESINGIGVFDASKTKYVPREFYEKMNSGKPHDYDVLLYKDGGKPGSFMPRLGMYGEGFPFEEFCINEHIFLLRAEAIGQLFLYFWIKQEKILNILRSAGAKAAIPGINRGDVQTLPILFPQKELLKGFAEKATPLITKILLNAKQIKTLSDLRDTLLPRLMSGKISIPDIEEQVA